MKLIRCIFLGFLCGRFFSAQGKLSACSSATMSWSTPGTTMKVTSTPSQDLALTNCAYCSRSDFVGFRLDRKDYGLCLVNNDLVLKFLYPPRTDLSSTSALKNAEGFLCILIPLVYVLLLNSE